MEGIQQGSIEKSIAIAKNMLQEGIPFDIIMKVTGLSQEEIERLN